MFFIRKTLRTLLYAALALFGATVISGCMQEEAWQPGKPLLKEKIKIAVLYIDKADANGYSFAHLSGVQQMQQQLGLDDAQIMHKYDISESDSVLIEHTIRECITAGANIIVATSWGYMEACEKLAAEYPAVIFAHASGNKYNATNFTSFFGRIYQARYLSGIVAGLKTRSNKIGFVAAKGLSNSEVTAGINAFALGVESVNPEARIHVRVTNSWYDPAVERRESKRLLDSGCDVIAQHCNTPIPQLEAEKAGVWGIGYNMDVSLEAPNSALTSVIWHWGVYYKHLVASLIKGTFTTTPYLGGVKEGMVGLAPLGKNNTNEAMASAVQTAMERILNDNFGIFDGPMRTADGRTIGEAGTTLTDDVIGSGMNWYYHTVIAENLTQ